MHRSRTPAYAPSIRHRDGWRPPPPLNNNSTRATAAAPTLPMRGNDRRTVVSTGGYPCWCFTLAKLIPSVGPGSGGIGLDLRRLRRTLGASAGRRSSMMSRRGAAGIDPGIHRDATRPDEPITVALVEDDDGDALLVKEMLRDCPQPIDVLHARTLADAMSLLAAADCVLLDLGLPDATGLSALERIRAAAADRAVIVLTGLHDERLGPTAVAAGAQDYLIKDEVNGEKLGRTIRYALQRQHAEEVESALLEERLHAQENVRLERGLIPHPLIGRSDLEVATHYTPGGGRMLLGGDFFDVVEDAAGAVHAIIGDVAGHGPDQAALGVALRIAWRTLVLAGTRNGETMPIMDRVLVHERHDDALFTTACTVTIPADRRTLALCGAGHPPPLLHADGAWSQLRQSGDAALGLFDGGRWTPATVALPDPPWELLLYTDGIVDARTGDDTDRLDVDGLLTLLNERHQEMRAAGGASATVDFLMADVQRLSSTPLTDDVALVLIANSGKPGEHA